ncbi:hypothetical protein B7463_g4880, partial [Scytalidium lignicola]
MDLESDWKEAPYYSLSSHEQHGHPPLTEVDGDLSEKWDEWAESLKVHNQRHHIKTFNMIIKPKLDYYYELGPEKLILPAVTFPSQPLEMASYEEKQYYLASTYRAVLEVALPGHYHRLANSKSTEQHTPGQDHPLYEQLKVSNSTSTIRLLEILPGSTEEQLVSTRLFTADLGLIVPQYEALSYAWGSDSGPRNQHSIRVNGLTQLVMPNLYSALSSLRHSSQSRTLWVDSICINQTDLEERSQQVLLMAKIFAQARRTIIYLGPSTPASTALFKFLQTPVCHSVNVSDEESQDYLDAIGSQFLSACRTAGSGLVEGFIDICSRSWWERVWILQEYQCSKQDPLFYCGQLEIPNKTLHKNFRRLYNWVRHQKVHPLPLDKCPHPACNKTLLLENASDQEIEPHGENVYEEAEKELQGRLGIPRQEYPGQEWAAWGYRVIRVQAIMARRSRCTPWTAPYFLFQDLAAQCLDPHDIVYGVRMGINGQSRKKKQIRSVTNDACILDGVLLMDGWLLDEIVEVFAFPSNDPFCLLQQLWYAERGYGRPAYMHHRTEHENKSFDDHYQRFGDMLKISGGITAYPSIPWATQYQDQMPTNISIGDVIGAVKTLTPLLSPAIDDYWHKIPIVVDCQLKQQYQKAGKKVTINADERADGEDVSRLEATRGLADLDLNSDADSEDEESGRKDRIIKMESRFSELISYLLKERWIDFVGICTFDYDNFRAQILHRILFSHHDQEPLGESLDVRGEGIDNPVICAPITYDEAIATIEKGCQSATELRFRESFVVDLATKVHEEIAGMVGLEGDSFWEKVSVGDKLDKFESGAECIGDLVTTIPLSALKALEEDTFSNLPEDLNNRLEQTPMSFEGHDSDEGDQTPFTLLHNDLSYPHEEWSQWRYHPKKHTSIVDPIFSDLLDFLVGRELFVTEGGLLGLANTGTQGIQKGDDLLLLEGMSFPLIARLEPHPKLGNPKKRRREVPTVRMRREILGTAVVRDIDPQGGDLDNVTWPEGFEPISGPNRGALRFK